MNTRNQLGKHCCLQIWISTELILAFEVKGGILESLAFKEHDFNIV
jgi:hypothetical protein